ncbi:NAD(P)H-binding protein [Luteolibacter ambystomatis]|uniref:NAD(P)H-binding protein n=1 Tax=Luteolibacter ambystomatis TaxID=2824561 RepID=A0A975IZY5_9BACT|nr:NAD(P)H-binding protein [Luteolibacter ambystomatis]QUE50805.1 NAD(P)H-binding protein [Luteolibacter ambystomatis]
MKVILFGASGMVGQGVLRECLLDPTVEAVLVVARSSLGQSHAKLSELVIPDVSDLTSVKEQLKGYDACFFPLGVSAGGMTEEAYRKLTYDLTLGAARTLAELNPGMTFIYVSGAGTDSTEHGRVMWARVKGATENALLRLPFQAVHLFRPGMIQPLHGIRSKTRLYDTLYRLTGFTIPLLRRMFPNHITTTEEVGRAMIEVARHGWPQPVLESRDIIAAGRK